MKIASVLSTKGGPGKTTVTANLGAFCADSNIRTLLIDLDTQPSLSSFYRLDSEAPGGTYQLISQNETIPDLVVSRTCIPNLSLIHDALLWPTAQTSKLNALRKKHDPFPLLAL